MYNITMNELFSGIGAQIAAMKRIGANCHVVGISDIDKYANQSYMAINGETRQYGDISKVARLDYADLWTYSFPCQDLSIAGKQAGIAKGTRSGLLKEVERLLINAIIEGTAPKFLLLENVKNLVGKKFKPDFDKWLETLEQLGYRNYWKVLNAKNYGVPQNRERVFVMSIRKDIECDYKFPEPVVLTKRLKDVLEPVVDEKYYLSDKYLGYIKNKENKDYNFPVELSNQEDIRKTPIRAQGDRAFLAEPLNTEPDGTSRTIKAQYYKNGRANFERQDSFGATGVVEPLALDEQNSYIRQDGCVGTLTTDGSSPKHNNRVVEPKIIQEPMNLYPTSGNPQAGRVYNADGISPAMDTCSGGNRMPKITEYRFFNQALETAQNAQNGDTIDAFNKRVNNSGVSPTLTTRPEGFKTAILPVQNYRIRKLTPKECWRLMGFTDAEFELAKASGVSNSQLYKQAGNSIVVDVLVGIFKSLFEGLKNEKS